MRRKKDKPSPVLGVDVCDGEAVRLAFLAMRVRASQAVSRANRSIRESNRLASHVRLLTMEMEVARQSLIVLQKDLDGMLKGLEDAHKRRLRETN